MSVGLLFKMVLLGFIWLENQDWILLGFTELYRVLLNWLKLNGDSMGVVLIFFLN